MVSSTPVLRTMMLGLALGIGFAQNGSTQTGSPMYQVPKTDNPLGQPMIATDGYVREDAMVPPPLLRPEDQKYGDYNGNHLKDILKEVTAISLNDRNSGNVFWGRNIGTAGHVAMENWSEERFRRYGLTDIRKEIVDIARPVWAPKSYDISFVGVGLPSKLPSARPSPSVSTPAGGLDLNLVWVGQGTGADFQGRDVKGKAVLIQEIPLPGDVGNSVQIEGSVKRAYDNGAAAVGLVFGISNNFALWQSTGGKYGFNLGYEDGMKIRRLLDEGKPVSVRYKLDAEFRTGVKSASVWGTLPGATNEEILIVSHMDGYFEAALDNASGMAVMMGMIEHYSKIPRAQRRRTMKFLSSVGHHGGPGTLSLHEKYDWSKVALLINLEHVAAVSTAYWGPNLAMSTASVPLRWYLNASPAVYKIMRDSLHRFNVATMAEIDMAVQSGPPGIGEISSTYKDAPSLALITSPEIKHTEQDTPEWVPASGLEQVSRAYSRIIDQLATLDRKDILPGKWPTTAEGAARNKDHRAF